MSDLFPFTERDVIAELEREIATRERVFPGWVASGKMTQSRADTRIWLMKEALRMLKEMPR